MSAPHRSAWAALIAVVMLSGCAVFSFEPARSLSDRIGYGYGTIAAVRTTAASAHDAGLISDAFTREVLDATDNARALLDLARVAVSENTLPLAQQRLELAVRLLMEIQSRLDAEIRKEKPV